MSDDEVFESAGGAGSALVYPIQAGALKKGDYMCIKGHPCKIIEVTVSKTGKHGHAKASITALDIFTKQKLEDMAPTTHNVDAPFVKSVNYSLMDVREDGQLALRSHADQQTPAPAQFVFDRGQLGGPAGLLAFVVSASSGDRDVLQAQVLEQAKQQLGLNLQPVQTVVEKRATFACTPGLERPPMQIAPGLLACGDYVAGPYPATLEGAVRAGQAAGQAVTQTSAP